MACLMALAHKPGGGDESCRTNRKLFALTATSPRPRLKENRAGECATALANGITTEHKPGNNAVTRTDKRTDELRASDFCRSGAFAASRRRSASLGRKAAATTTTTTQLWQREAGLYICLFLSRRNDLDYRRNGAAAALLHDTGRRRSIWGFLQREREPNCRWSLDSLSSSTCPVTTSCPSGRGQRGGQVFAMLTQTANLLPCEKCCVTCMCYSKNTRL